MNGALIASWQRLIAIEGVYFKVTKSSVKSKENPYTAKLDRFQNRKFSVEFRRVRISLTFDT